MIVNNDNITGNQLCSLRFSAMAFTKDWCHCDQLSNYVSRLVSSNKIDSFVFSNLFSTVINEVLEAIFRNNSGNDHVEVSIYQAGNDSLIVSSIPVDDVSRDFYDRVISGLKNGDAKDMYRELIKREKGFAPETGFYELAADYDADISLEHKPDGKRIALSVRVCLEPENGAVKE